MGVSRSPAELANKLDRFAKTLDTVTQDAVADAAEFVVREVDRQIRQAAPSMRLRGTSKAGQAIRGTADMLTNRPNNPAAIVKVKGTKFHVLERDTKRHVIMPKRARRQLIAGLVATGFGASGKRRRSTGKRPLLRTPYGPRPFVNHPGTKGKHPFEKGVNLSAKRVPDIIQGGVSKALRQVF